MFLAKYPVSMVPGMNNKGFLPALVCSLCVSVCAFAHVAFAGATEQVEHFTSGEFNGSLSWDGISAIETGVYRFGGSAGLFLLNGLEVGYEQQFIMPPGTATESRSWGFVRLVPFRSWPVAPFLAVRLGYYYLPDKNAAATGVGCGATVFVSSHIAFEASLYAQFVFHPLAPIERQTEFDTRFVLYF